MVIKIVIRIVGSHNPTILLCLDDPNRMRIVGEAGSVGSTDPTIQASFGFGLNKFWTKRIGFQLFRWFWSKNNSLDISQTKKVLNQIHLYLFLLQNNSLGPHL